MSYEFTNKTMEVTVANPVTEAVGEHDEGRLLAAARKGDRGAFAGLVMPHENRILHIAQRITRNHEDAEDVVQISMLQAFRHLDGFQGNSRFSTWLIRIVTNEALMKLRARQRHHEVSLEQMGESDGAPKQIELLDPRSDPEQNCARRELRGVLGKAIEQLGPSHREVFQLRCMKELSAQETAKILGVPVSTVKARLHRARLSLLRNARSLLSGKDTHPSRRRRSYSGEIVRTNLGPGYTPVTEHALATCAQEF